MNIPVNVQPIPTSPSVAPNGEIPIAQSINGTSITNIVTINDIGNEIGTDNSTNIKIRKNGKALVMLIFYEHGAHRRRTRNRSSKHRFGLKLWTLSWNCSFFLPPVCLFAVMRNYGIENKNDLHLCNKFIYVGNVCSFKFSVIRQKLNQRPHIAIGWERKFRS